MTAQDIGQAPDRRLRTLITPEGVELRIELADVGQRLAAVLLDLLFIFLITAALAIVCLIFGAAIGESVGGAVLVIWVAAPFVIRNAWFLLFEMSAKAATPGKRILGLRVATRDGGRLRFEAIFTRNAMRELELFLPLMVMTAGPFVAMSGGGWMYLMIVIWCGVFVSLPLFNRDRLRAGDMVAGTWVVRAPRQKLLRDMADAGEVTRSDFLFTPGQLDAYGVKELQVLEQVLRTRDRPTVRAVADRISGKIGYAREGAADIEFLQAYYFALRQRLESRLLMGRRRKDKFDLG